MLAHWPARQKDRLGFGSLRAVVTHAYPASYALPQKFAAGKVLHNLNPTRLKLWLSY